MKKLALSKLFPPGEKFKRLVRVMKITWLIILLATMQISASVYSQQTTFNVEFKNASLYDLMKEIKSNSEFDFIYSDDEIESVKINDANFYGSHVEEILDECLEGTEITYTVEDKVIILMPAPPKPIIKTPVQKYEVKGTVTDKDGVALPGVSVVVKGTSFGTATDINGNYTLKLDNPNAILVFSFVGMNVQEIVYNGQKVIDVSLTADTESLNEVVITGYTKTSKVRSAASSTKIVSEDVQRQVTADLDDRMEGLSTGLNINSVTPDGGEERLELILRGISTFDTPGETYDPTIATNNSLNRQPLIVVDGFPYEGPFNDIDQSIIESIDVLKDAAATALWGLRASNGVIVITTKRGREGKPRVSLSTTFTMGTKQDLSDLGLASSKDVIGIRNNFMELNPTNNRAYNAINYQGFGWTNTPTGWVYGPIDNWGNKYASMDAFDQIWAEFYASPQAESDIAEREAKLAQLAQNDILPQFEDQLLRNGFANQNSINIQGGSSRINYNLALSNTLEKKPIKGDEMKRLNFSLSTDIKLSEKLSVIADVSLANSEKRSNGIGVSALYTSSTGVSLNRFDQLVGSDGNRLSVRDVYAPYKDEFLANGFDDASYNPIDEYHLNDNKLTSRNVRFALGANYKITNWLTADVKFQTNRVENKVLNNREPETYEMRRQLNTHITEFDDGTGTGATRAVPYGGMLERNVRVTTYDVLRGSLNFHKVFGDDHVVSGLVGMEATENEYTVNQQRFVGYNDRTGLYDKNFAHGQFGNYGTITGSKLGGSYNNSDSFIPSTVSRQVASFSNLGYSYKAKYNIEGSVKVAQATAFGINKRLSKNLLWALGGSWNINKEEFMQANWLDVLKLRASYGVNGNMRRGETTVTVIGYSSNDPLNQTPYARVTNPGNPYLAPEKTHSLNLGLDFGVFNRVMGSLDVYDKRSTDLLVPKNTNDTYGLGSVSSNEGEISNKGIEFSLQADLIKKADFKWNANFNISYNKNEVIKYGYRPETKALSYYIQVQSGSTKIIGEDVSVRAFFDYAGLDENGQPQVYNREGEIVSSDDPTFNDLTQDDMIVSKPFIAPVFGGLTNAFSYKNFTLTAFMTFKFGHEFTENLSAKYGAVNSAGNGTVSFHKDVANAWKQAGDENVTGIPAWQDATSAQNALTAFTYSNYGLHDAAHIRLKDITLNYEFNKDLLNKVGLNKASLMFQVRNLGIIWAANDKNIDPESVPFSGRDISYAGFFQQSYRPGIKVPVSFVLGAKIEF